MNWFLCVSLLLYVVFKAECRSPVIIRRLPTLADVNLTALPRKFEDRGFYHVKHFVRVKTTHTCKWFPRVPVRTQNKTMVKFFESNILFDDYVQYGWMDEYGQIDETISSYDSLFHPELELFYQLENPCPSCVYKVFTSDTSTSEFSFDDPQAAYDHPWHPNKVELGTQECEPPKQHGYGAEQNKLYDPTACTISTFLCFGVKKP
uniref:SKICH domain-containing protein n=1 Tax=Panagrellus redivivus TaxID=6233 RepID=A0A7E4V7H5_PANRE